MKFKVTRPDTVLNAQVKLPVSKSISNRLLIMDALAGNVGEIEDLSDSDDTRVMIDALQSGSKTGDVGHAGTSMRFLTAYFSTKEGEVVLTGSHRMKERPIGPLVDGLRWLGANISYLEKEGYPPLKIKGRTLQGGEIRISGDISSQFISALLMIAPVMKNGLVLKLVGEVVSASYIKMTLGLMSECGANTNWQGNTITVEPGEYTMTKSRVESDWSAASYWYAMGLLVDHSRLQLSYLNNISLQGDSVLVRIFHGLGLISEFNGQTLTISKLANIHPGQFKFNFTDSPDIVQSMAVALCMAAVPFRFTGTQTLRIKETDRILALQTEMKKLGYILESDERGSFLSWNKKRCTPEREAIIDTYHDHRMAMAFVPVALVNGSVIIRDPMVVTKSYPGFWNDLKNSGFGVEEMPESS